jgi:MraZ protein
VFRGTFRFRLDAKGRLPVPAAFRRHLSSPPEAVVVTLIDQCMAAFPAPEWRRLADHLLELPALRRDVKAVTRLLASRAVDCPLDGQGRILLPRPLRQAAGISREAVVVGALNRFEIWAPEAWDGFMRDAELLLDEAAIDLAWPVAPPPFPRSEGGRAQGNLKR